MFPGVLFLHFKSDMIGDHGYKLAVGGFASAVENGIAEVAVQDFEIAVIPCQINGTSDRPLHLRWRGSVHSRNHRIDHLGCWAVRIRIVQHQKNCRPDIVVAFDMNRNADFTENFCDPDFRVVLDRVQRPVDFRYFGWISDICCHFVFSPLQCWCLVAIFYQNTTGFSTVRMGKIEKLSVHSFVTDIPNQRKFVNETWT